MHSSHGLSGFTDLWIADCRLQIMDYGLRGLQVTLWDSKQLAFTFLLFKKVISPRFPRSSRYQYRGKHPVNRETNLPTISLFFLFFLFLTHPQRTPPKAWHQLSVPKGRPGPKAQGTNKIWKLERFCLPCLALPLYSYTRYSTSALCTLPLS